MCGMAQNNFHSPACGKAVPSGAPLHAWCVLGKQAALSKGDP